MNYIRGRMYIGNVDIRVEKRNLRSLGNERMVRDIRSICHARIPGPTRLANSNRVRGARPYTGTFYLFFFFLKAELLPVGIQTISIITKIIYIHKRTTTGVVSIKIYTHILCPIYLYKYLYMYISNTNIKDRGKECW